jgi:hypothetical protein
MIFSMEAVGVANETRQINKPDFLVTLREQTTSRGLALGIRMALSIHSDHLTRSVEGAATQDVLNNKPVILLVPHNYSNEVLAAIAGIPSSEETSRFRDVKLLSEASPNKSWFDQYTLPLFNVDRRDMPFVKHLSRAIHPKIPIPTEEATFANFKSLRQAAEIVAGNGLVVLCPEGTKNKDGHWEPGVSALVKLAQRYLSKNGNGEGYIVMCDVQGIGLVNHLTGNAFKKVSVRYSEPIPLSDIKTDDEISGEEIALGLEKRYRSWTKTSPK